MTRKIKDPSRRNGTFTLPDQQDESDILAGVEGERDENGKPVIDEEQLREIGAVDAESVRANLRAETFVKQKRGKVDGVTFSSDDPLERYEALLKICAPNTLDISVTRRSGGSPDTLVVKSRPKSGVELYAAIEAIHGIREAAEYEIRCHDSGTRQYRMSGGRITMPDTRPPQQQGQPMGQPGYPPPYGAPPGYPYSPQYYPPPQAQPQAPAGTGQASPQPPAPIYVQPSAGPDPMAMFPMFQQMFELVRSTMAPPSQPNAAPVFMPPPPPTNPDPTAMMQWMQQMADLVRQLQTQAARGAAQQQPQPQTQAPMSQPTQTGPGRPPPPGMIWAWEPSYNSFVLMPAPSAAAAPSPFSRRPAYYPQGDPGAPQQPQQPPQRPVSPLDQFRNAIGVVRSMQQMAEEAGMLSGGAQEPVTPQDEDSPIRIVDTGAGKLAFGRDDSFRLWESGFANLGDFLKWGGDQIQKINKANAERARELELQRSQPRVLPSGLVEVPVGWQPPPGYKMEVVEEQPQALPSTDLPRPPAEVPPPLRSAAPTPRQSWTNEE